MNSVECAVPSLEELRSFSWKAEVLEHDFRIEFPKFTEKAQESLYSKGLFFYILKSQKERFPEGCLFEGKTLSERESLISDWNFVQMCRYTIKGKPFSEKERGTEEEKVVILASSWREYLERHKNIIDSYKNLKMSFKRLTEIPREVILFHKCSHIDASMNKIRFIPDCVGTMKSLQWLNLENNILTFLPKTFKQDEFISLSIKENNFTENQILTELSTNWDFTKGNFVFHPQSSYQGEK